MEKSDKTTERIKRFYTLKGSRISDVYETNKMRVHNQGFYLSVYSPQTIVKAGTLTLSAVISPQGAITGMIDAGALIFLNDNPLQLASIPFVRINGNEPVMLTSQSPSLFGNPDDFPLPEKNYYRTMAMKDIEVSIAIPLAQLHYNFPKTDITRRFVSPLLSKTDQFLPASVEEYVIRNRSKSVQQITLVVPMPSLVNLSRKISRPAEQDYTFLGAAAISGNKHGEFSYKGITGVRMESTRSRDRMIIAVPRRSDLSIAVQEAFKLRNFKQDLTLNEDGSFHHPNTIIDGNDYGAAVGITVIVPAGKSVSVPVVKIFDFPEQQYVDKVSIARRYTVDYPNESTSDRDMAATALRNYPGWLERTITLQEKILDSLLLSPAYRRDKNGALRVARLLFNETSYLLSNTSVLDVHGRGRFLECFDYPFNNSADVDFYSKLLLTVFPQMELELCKKFIDSINMKDDEFRFYHTHFYDPLMQQSYLDELKKSGRRKGGDIHVYAAKKAEGALFHDLGSLNFGNAFRDVSDYIWYNTAYWIDLYPKLALRVLRDAKYSGDVGLVVDNWATIKKGFNYFVGLDYDNVGIPEGRPGEVRNTYDNIPFAGVDAYDANLFIACLYAMIRMAEMTGDGAEIPRFKSMLEKAHETYEKLWLEVKRPKGGTMSYYITCTGVDGKGRCTDVFTDQLVGLWQWIAMGEKPFLPEDRVVKLLKTIFINNKTPMGWATARKLNGAEVDSDQGKDVWIASNYVLAQMLDYYGLTKESKEVYRLMDKIIFDHGNSLNTAESVRPKYEKEPGEKKPGPHYIVASYPRPGAIYDTLYLNAIKKEWEKNPDTAYISTEKLQKIRSGIFGTDAKL
jgi:uncharacterized protein (DUF608 family)